MTDGRDELLSLVEGSNQFEDFGIAAELVRHESARAEHSIKIVGIDLGDRHIGFAGIAMLSLVFTLTLGSGQHDGVACFLKAILRIPELKILIDVSNENEHLEVVRRRVGSRHHLQLVVQDKESESAALNDEECCAPIGIAFSRATRTAQDPP